MSIDVECECGNTIEVDEYISLYNEDYSPILVKCPDCGKKYNVCIHMEFIGE
jgi:hypothetical protein